MATQILDFFDRDTHHYLRALISGAAWERDDRAGLRAAAICKAWSGFALFLERAGERHPLFRGDLAEVQATKMVGGESFAAHKDGQYSFKGEDDPENNQPTTTFVYYVGDHASFTGGRLFTQGEAVEPIDNSLVMFDGLVDHSIELIEGHAAQRLTINGCYRA